PGMRLVVVTPTSTAATIGHPVSCQRSPVSCLSDTSHAGQLPSENHCETRSRHDCQVAGISGGTTMTLTKPEDVISGKKRPFTGEEYLESLRDGREVYVYGERVADVTTHPAFRNAARTIAKLYDALHHEKSKDILTCPTDTGSGGFTHKFFRVG